MATAPIPACAPVAIPDIFSNLGVGFLGLIASSIAYGVICIQTFQYHYSSRSKSDHASLRFLVFILWIFDTVYQSFAIQMFYFYLVENFNNPVAGNNPVWTIGGCILVNASIQLSVKTCYIIRIWRISHSRYLVALISILNIVRFGLDVWFSAKFFSLIPLGGTRAEIENRLLSIGITSLGLEALTGVLISATGVYQLLKHRSSLRKSNNIIGRMVIMMVATGTLSALFVTANFIAYLVSPKTLYVLALNFMIGKMDINALLTSLNSRKYIRGDQTQPILLPNVSAGSELMAHSGTVVCKVDVKQTYTER